MPPNRPPDWRTNTFKAYNGVGLVLMVLTAPVIGIAWTDKKGPAGQVIHAGWAAGFLVLCFLLALVRIKLQVWAPERCLVRSVGIWPFLVERESRISPTSIELSAYRARYGPIYQGCLNRSDGKAVTLLTGGSSNDLKPLVDLAQRLQIPLKAGKGMDRYKPPWLTF